MNAFKYYSLIITIPFFFSSCNPVPSVVQPVLEKAGNNRKELEKVISHYRQSGEKEKLKAAYFLIGNMDDKYSLDGEGVRNFDGLFTILDSLYHKKGDIANNSPLVQQKWDSLVRIYGRPFLEDADRLDDYKFLKADYLIEQIDLAFKIRDEVPWGKSLSAEQFCEYVLPYRIGNERTEDWRKYLYDKYKPFRDTTKAKNRFEYTLAINAALKPMISTNHTLWSYPFSVPVSIMEKGHLGACMHLVSYTAMVMQANGLPVGIDLVRLWGNHRGNHQWNTLLMKDGTFYPFGPATASLEGKAMFTYKFAKAFRKTFAKQDIPAPEYGGEVPDWLINKHLADVTNEYTQTYDIAVPLIYAAGKKKHTALICTYASKNWSPQDWGEIKDDKAFFKNMGSDIAYMAMYFDGSTCYPASDPFILTKNGSVKQIKALPEEKQNIILFRKYPLFHIPLYHMTGMVGVRIQGADKADFSDSVNLFTVTKVPAGYEDAKISNPRKFRYVRVISSSGKPASIAELEFYGKAGQKLQGKFIGEPISGTEFPLKNAFDGDPGTYFWGKKGDSGWAGLDLVHPKQITKVRYCPRSDTNFIIAGDTYELCYWDKDKWISLGKQAATGQKLICKNVPRDALYLLHDLSRGNEERIFTYENGKQVWW